ncbi:MAG: anhydro-N-acetylmuramic acid kinase [Pirellulales bacterium]|nr:anhydro-N-acetylmuramic acid kinase [Pirellulales bacterium]
MVQQRLRSHPAHPDGSSRCVMGISIASSCGTLRGVLIDAVGHGSRTRVEFLAAVALPIDEVLVVRLRKLATGSGADFSVDTLGQLRAELAEVQVEAIQGLVAEAAVAPNRILVAGIDDPGLWCVNPPDVRYFSLCDAARVAETTGISIVDSFPARDLAQGGQGGPIGALPQWVLLKQAQENCLLVDLGRTTRLSFLPSDSCLSASSRITSFDVGPGTWLLDELAAKLTGGREPFDPGGRFAVQGRRIDALLDHWLADHLFSQTSPRWHPRGVRPERFLNDALRMAVEAHWSVQDLLCTATHLIAEALARATRERLPDDLPIDRILVTGGGQHNGMLLREITARVRDVPLSRTGELGIEDHLLEPACIALLALFHLDQVPGNLCSVTGAEIPRVLGHLTPGSPQNWQRLLHYMSGARPTVRPLRSAL